MIKDIISTKQIKTPLNGWYSGSDHLLDANVTAPEKAMDIQRLRASYGKTLVLRDIDLPIPSKRITAIIGPSGCGKSTLVRCLNRMHELTPGASVEGNIIFDGANIYRQGVDPVDLRGRIGMVFQKPNPFPKSVFENVVFGLRVKGRRGSQAETVERSLRQAGLWDEVKDRLNQNALTLSGGQQQRLCIARALAVDPEVILMDEPCSALDPMATLTIEELIRSLAKTRTIVIVTHNMQQAARVSHETAFLSVGSDGAGHLIERGETRQVFTNPREERTEAYITGRFG